MRKCLALLMACLLLATPVLVDGAVTITNTYNTPEHWGWKGAMVVDFTFDDSYPTGGETLTPGLLGLSSIEYVSDGADTARTKLVTTKWIPSTGKIMAFYTAAYDSVYAATTKTTVATEVTASYNLSTCTVRLLVLGK